MRLWRKCTVSDLALTSDESALRARVKRRVDEAYEIVEEATYEHIRKYGKDLAGEVVCFSGGDDSTVLAHLFRNDVDFAAHINTGICVIDDAGASRAAQYVRERCAEWDLPLIEEHGESYEERVLRHGFPGPGQHFQMYRYLKERGLRKVRRRLVKHSRRERVLFIAGMRRQESDRRSGNVERHHRDGSIVWASPLVEWSAADMNDYRTLYGVQRSPVSAELHMSGECLCGAFARPGELDEIEFWSPPTAVHIRRLEAKVAASGNAPPERCQWGWGAYRTDKPKVKKTGPLCAQCVFSFGDST